LSNLATIGLDSQKVELISRTIAKGCSTDELALFVQICKRTGLDPFARQIHAVKRWDGNLQREVMQTQVSIDGARLIAQRSGEYAGQDGPYWCGDDGVWKDCWLSHTPPRAAKVFVSRKGFVAPISAVANFNEYAQRKKDGALISMWAKMPALMIAKCAEALALRKAFPAELGGIYTDDEVSASSDAAPQFQRSVVAPTDGVAEHGEEGQVDASTPVLPPAAPPPAVKTMTKADAIGIIKALKSKEIPLEDLRSTMTKAQLIGGDEMTTWPKEWLPRIQSWIKGQKSRVPEPPAEDAAIDEIV
jgi:phage recombination protein Bet